MIRDITIGQYYPVDSVLHRLDARVKLIGTALYICSLFLFREFKGYLVAGIFLCAMIRLSKVPFRYMVRGLKAVFFFMLFTAVLNMFFTPGIPICQWGVFKITQKGLKAAAFMVLRLIFLILGSSLMTLTTTPGQLADGLENLFAPLVKWHVPVHDIAMMMSIALRFIPILTEETDKIMKAQMARGADFESGNIVRRGKNMLPILVPLLVSAARRANDLAMAMDARCYHCGAVRTKMKPLRYRKRDGMAFAGMGLYLAVLIIITRFVRF